MGHSQNPYSLFNTFMVTTPLLCYMGLPGDSVVKNPCANARDIADMGWIPGLGRPLEKGMATPSNILAWRIPWTEEPGGVTKSWA